MAKNRRVTALVTVTLGAAVLGGGGIVLAQTALGATVEPGAPQGEYHLSATDIWPGQSITVVQDSLVDDLTPNAVITQVVDWGDGSAPSSVPGTTTRIAHVYPEAGTYSPTVTVSDGTDARVYSMQAPSVVSVNTYVAHFKLRQTAAFVGQPVSLEHHESDDTDTVRISWGDGTTSTAKADINLKTVAHAYAKAGTFTVTAAPANANGTAAARTVGTVTAKTDSTKPVVSLTRPANPTKATSWSTVRGKSSDAGAGVRNVTLTAVEKRGSAWYYYTGSAWKKASSSSVAAKKAKVLTVVPSGSGAWSTKIKSLTKGTVRFAYAAIDRAGNRSATKTLDQKISR
ncbi:PKD domain-containing protein [Krasilnikovia sp. MM14-A1259]|uniref:PKD domain-containing protein n=1 Tax=Krasilnikovia sp. MM14-A1259 TaxID=3373539 RepID=UPI0037F19B2F